MVINKRFEDIILDSVLSLHRRRERYNGKNIGFGYDEYKPYEKFHYPEAYALWGRGYLKLFKLTREEKYLNFAEKCAEWLIENRNQKYKNFSWGLPWKWDGRPKEYSYVTTSTFAGDFFIHMYTLMKDKKYFTIAKSIGAWIIEENGFGETGNGIWFFYSDHPSLQYPILNAISMASSFFSKLYFLTKNTYYEKLAIESTKYVIKSQNKDGSWYYSTKRAYIDNVHTGFTIEGLCDVCTIFPSLIKKYRDSLLSAYDFYWSKLYLSNGFGKERIRNELLYKIKYSLLRNKIETRIHGYAAGIRAFTKLSKIFSTSNKGLIIAKYIIENLQTEDGAFKFKPNENKYYIRHEGHVFDALTFLLSLSNNRFNIYFSLD